MECMVGAAGSSGAPVFRVVTEKGDLGTSSRRALHGWGCPASQSPLVTTSTARCFRQQKCTILQLCRLEVQAKATEG